MPADITLVNLNMLFMRYGEEVERELHVPLGPLYLTKALEQAGFTVDFRDYQCVDSDEPFDRNVFLDFLRDPRRWLACPAWPTSCPSPCWPCGR